VLSACERDGIAFLPWSPLSAGSDAARVSGAIAEVAARHQATPAQVAIAWLLARTPVMLPIPGTSSLAHLEENLQAARLRARNIRIGRAFPRRIRHNRRGSSRAEPRREPHINVLLRQWVL
jgi:aryl-alcohol dehydrogenase-like predicted oxidoreductase